MLGKIDNDMTRKLNSLLVLKEIMKQPISRTELAAKLSLTMGGLTPIIRNLISSGLIIEYKSVESVTQGRKPIFLSINKNKFKIVVIDISRTKYSVSVVNFGNTIIESKEIFYQENILTKEDFLGNIFLNLECIMKRYEIAGIIVATPGPIDYTNGIILNPPNFNGWSNIEIKKELSEKLLSIKKQLPIIVEHDIDSTAYAEKYLGVAKEYESFMTLKIDEAIGCGLFVNNKNFRKYNQESCEIGHMSINIFGSKCECGNTGCLENYVNKENILKKVRVSKKQNINWSELCFLYKSGDRKVEKIVDDYIEILGGALVSFLNILKIDLIVLNGSFAQLGDSVAEKLEKIIVSKLIFTNKGVKVKITQLKNAEITGSSILFFEEFLWKNDMF